MLAVVYSGEFIRKYKKLEPALQEEVKRRITEFKSPRNHRILKVHKLKGIMKGRMSFAVNFRYRVVFTFSDDKKSAILLSVGGHSIYE